MKRRPTARRYRGPKQVHASALYSPYSSAGKRMADLQRIRILLLIPHLGGGGAERVMELLAGGLAHDRYEVHLGLATGSCDLDHALPPWVTVHAMGARRVRGAGSRLLGLVWRLKPHSILSGMFHLNFLVLLLRPLFPRGTRVLVRQNGTVSAALAPAGMHGTKRFLYRALYRMLYRGADCILCQSAAMARDLAAQLAIPAECVAVLPNPIDIDRVRAVAAGGADCWHGRGPHLVAVGRLSHEKGFDLLIAALASVRARFPGADLVVAGAGAEEAPLKALSAALGLTAAVHLAGYAENPEAWFGGATLFVLPSRHEGLPNALLEAAAAGLPLVATPASGGITDLLRGQPGAWLAEGISASAVAAAIESAVDALEPGQRFAHDFIEPFRLERAIQAYAELIDPTVAAATAVERPA